MSLHARIRLSRGRFRLDVELQARPAEVLAVLGPNAAGKSTLLRALAGLAPLEAGLVELDGVVLDDTARGYRLAPRHRRIGMVFQDYRLFPHLSARDNVAFGPRSTGASRAAARAEADRWLARLGLSAVAGHRPAALSGGQAQRVALARALCGQSRLVLLDEPLSALDVPARGAVRAGLRRELAGFPGPAVLVTHDPLEAMSLADRLLILEGGRVVQQGTPAEVSRRPATGYVAGLVGLNLLRGRASGGLLEVDGGGRLAVADGSLAGPALAVVRPSAVLVQTARPGPSSARNVWPGQVTALEALGDRVRVAVQGTPAVLADITPQAVAELRLAAGDLVWLSAKATDIECYPA